MPTGNERYFDAAIRHQVGIRRFASGEAKEVLLLLERADRELVEKIRRRLARVPVGDATTERLKALLKDMRAARREVMLELRRRLRPDLVELSNVEVDFEQRMIQGALPVKVDFAAVDLRQVHSAIFSRPFEGRPLREWFNSLESSDARRLNDAIRLGVTQGETIQQIMRRVAGTPSRGFSDGALALTRRQAEAVTRTAVNHVTNVARETVWRENEDIVSMVRWTATLDGRTSPICRRRDGKVAPVGDRPLPPLPEGVFPLDPPGARPPGHVGCRSVMVAVLDGVGVLGDRPFVRDTRRRDRREVDLRAQAREQGKSIQQVRREWSDANVGQIPAETTYGQWLKRQPASFQDEVLGKTRGRLFRTGKIKIEQFVDRKGNEFTLDELRATHPEAF